jgi:hypothetical protein
MRFCVAYTNSHRSFLDEFFLKTFPFESGVSLVLERMPQKCSSGWLFSDGWRDQMVEKQKFINKSLETFFLNEILVFSDVDISFYGDVKEDLIESLGDNDIAFMKDHNSDEFGRCGGFFILKSNDKTRRLFSQVLSSLLSLSTLESTTFRTSEQQTINSVLNSMPDVKWTYLPPRYYTHGLYTEGLKNFSEENQAGLWWENKDEEEKQNVFIPDDMKVHHANWASGVECKMKLLEFVHNKKGGTENGK